MDTSLTSAEQTELLGLAASSSTPRYVAQRAALALHRALAADGPAPGSDARTADIEKSLFPEVETAVPWLDIYRSHGVAGLRDAPHRGRPRSLSPTTVTQVLTEPLLSPLPRLTSRIVAEAAGVSQSSVVRVWQRAYEPRLLPPDLRRTLTDGGNGILIGLHVSADNFMLAIGFPQTLSSTGGAAGGSVSEPPKSTHDVRRPLQALLAADLVRSSARARGSLGPFVRDALRFLGTRGRTVLLCREAVDDLADAELRRRRSVALYVLSASQWQALLTHMEGCIASPSTARLDDLRQALRAWATDPLVAFEWLQSSLPLAKTAPPRSAATPDPGPTASQRLAAAVTVAIQDAILDGRLRSGDRVTEAFLARATHASRSQVRDALKTLAFDGLVDLEAGPGAIVPEPTLEDVAETYAARRALGAILVQRAVSWRPDAIGPVRRALEELRKASLSGDSWITGEADLSFQDAIVDSVAMRRIPAMFKRLTVQLRMFVAVMGLDYAYSVEAMVEEDSALLAAITRRDSALALTLWEQKMLAVTQYMTRQLEGRRAR